MEKYGFLITTEACGGQTQRIQQPSSGGSLFGTSPAFITKLHHLPVSHGVSRRQGGHGSLTRVAELKARESVSVRRATLSPGGY